ncbi:MAG: ATP synthase subunit I [Methanotrichaceae archaeon]|nr:ATP synthase subunit I [Methanotrichaceae archaeon]
MIQETVTLILSTSLGIALGIFYFGGLWITTRRLPGSSQPALLALSSFLVRSLICLLGFYLVVGNGLTSSLLCLAAFILTKMVMVRHLGYGSHAEGEMNG